MASDDWFLVDPTGGVPSYFHAQRVKTGGYKGVRATIKIPDPIDSPLLDSGTKYIFTITHLFGDSWWVRVTNVDGSAVYEKQIDGTGMTQGDQIHAAGEVTGRAGTNDMGTSPLLSLQYRHPTNGWQPWNGYINGTMDSPFVIKGIIPDPDNNLFVYGNNKSPVPADAPCP